MTAPTTYICPIDGCTAEISTSRLMCLRHWNRVPKDLRSAVNHTWAAYLRDPRGEGGKVVRRYRQVRTDAIAAVNAQIPPQVAA